MKAAVVSDTSPLNYLVLIDAADLLPRLFSGVIIPPAVVEELSQSGTPDKVRRWLLQAPDWIKRIDQESLNRCQVWTRGRPKQLSWHEKSVPLS